MSFIGPYGAVLDVYLVRILFKSPPSVAQAPGPSNRNRSNPLVNQWIVQ